MLGLRIMTDGEETHRGGIFRLLWATGLRAVDVQWVGLGWRRVRDGVGGVVLLFGGVDVERVARLCDGVGVAEGCGSKGLVFFYFPGKDSRATHSLLLLGSGIFFSGCILFSALTYSFW